MIAERTVWLGASHQILRYKVLKSMLFICRELCVTGEKWFVSGEGCSATQHPDFYEVVMKSSYHHQEKAT